MKGLTLIELMISMAILVAVITSSYYVILVARQMSEESHQKVLAMNVARSVLEAIKDTPVQNLGTIPAGGFIPPDLPQGTVTILTNPSPVGTAQIATVTVRVGWQGPRNMAKRLEVTTMRSRF